MRGMQRKILSVLIVGSIVGLLEAGVKIEISRVKDPPKPASVAQNTGIDSPAVGGIGETTPSITTAPMTPPTTSQTTVSITTATSVPSLTNPTSSPINSVTEVTTISPPNTNGSVSPAPANTTNITNVPILIPTFVYNVSYFQPKDVNSYLSEFTRRQLRRRLIPADYYCPCDLKINFCDINCCCDVDCASHEIMQALKCSERDWSIHDYEESSELQLCSQTRQFSLFCVVDNSRRRKQARRRDYKVHDVNIMSVVQYRWPDQYTHGFALRSDYRDHYIYGDDILVWDVANEEIRTLDIPWSFGASNCRIKNAQKHLVDAETKCVQTLDEHDQFMNDFQTKLKSLKILKYRKPLETPPIIMKDFCKSAPLTTDNENCTETEIYHCINTISSRTCIQDTNSTSTAPSEFGANVISDELSIQIHHNFTNILNVTVFFVYHEFNSESPPAQIVQRISTEYLEINETFATRDVHQVSGNIGYLHHKPIIVTKIIYQNQTYSDGSVQIIGLFKYFHNETNCTNDDHYLKMPAIEPNGDCIIDNNTFQTIDFGENSRIKCHAVLSLSESNDTDSMDTSLLGVEPNNTLICRDFQRQILNYLLHRFELENPNATIYNRFNLRISEMGNPKNDAQHWIDFQTMYGPNLDEIVAVDGANGEFTCTNIILGVRYDFFYGTQLVGRVSNQALIKVAVIKFGNRLNLKFKLDEDVLKVPLNIDVMFFDFSHAVGNAPPNIRPHITAIISIVIFIRSLVTLM